MAQHIFRRMFRLQLDVHTATGGHVGGLATALKGDFKQAPSPKQPDTSSGLREVAGA